jgi:histidyl-tRNA synthetase
VAALQAYFEANRASLSPESQTTLDKNALRVLDSKRPDDQAIVAAAPRIADFYSSEAASHFSSVQAGLTALDIPYAIDDTLVRGLDYYRHTTFEYQGGTLDSAQNALGGGGRYDGLVESLGGPSTHGIGFALGLDRTLLACDDEGVFPARRLSLDAFVVDTTGGFEALRLTAELRAAGLSADRAYENRSMKAQMKVADRSGASVAVIIGSNELAEDAVTVRPLRTDDGQQTIARSTLIDYLKKART